MQSLPLRCLGALPPPLSTKLVAHMHWQAIQDTQASQADVHRPTFAPCECAGGRGRRYTHCRKARVPSLLAAPPPPPETCCTLASGPVPTPEIERTSPDTRRLATAQEFPHKSFSTTLLLSPTLSYSLLLSPTLSPASPRALFLSLSLSLSRALSLAVVVGGGGGGG